MTEIWPPPQTSFQCVRSYFTMWVEQREALQFAPLTWRLSSSRTEQFRDGEEPVSFWRLQWGVSLWSGTDRATDRGVWKKTNLYVSSMYLWALTIRHYFDMDNKLQELLTLLSLLAALMQLNSAFYHAISAYMYRRKDVSANCNSFLVVQWRYQPYPDWSNFVKGVVVPEE